MNQVGYERHWLHILATYVRPLQEKVFTGYFHNVSRGVCVAGGLLSLLILRVPDQNGVPLLHVMLDIHHSGQEHSVCEYLCEYICCC